MEIMNAQLNNKHFPSFLRQLELILCSLINCTLNFTNFMILIDHLQLVCIDLILSQK